MVLAKGGRFPRLPNRNQVCVLQASCSYSFCYWIAFFAAPFFGIHFLYSFSTFAGHL